MAKKRGNPDWGKPDLHTARNNGPTSFEEIVSLSGVSVTRAALSDRACGGERTRQLETLAAHQVKASPRKVATPPHSSSDKAQTHEAVSIFPRKADGRAD